MTWIWQKTATANDAVNLSPATGAELVFFLKEALKQAGWAVQSSSDGTTYNASGDQITTGAAGAGGMANNSAWFRIRSPAGAGGREFTFQRGTANTAWRSKMSHSAGFTGGAPAATVTPSATDEAIYAGAGTDAAPTFITWLAADASYKAHIGTDNAAPYNAYCLAVPNGGGNVRRWWYTTLASGSYPAADVAPYLTEIGSASMLITALDGTVANTDCFGQGWYKKGLGGEAFTQFRWIYPMYQNGGNQQAIGSSANGLGDNPYNGGDDVFPIHVARATVADANPGHKGFTDVAMMGWCASNRSDGDAFDFGALRYAYFDDIAIRWPPGVVPSL